MPNYITNTKKKYKPNKEFYNQPKTFHTFFILAKMQMKMYGLYKEIR